MTLASVSGAPFSFVELFAGGGMARLGLGADWRCVLANDISPTKAASYIENFGADDFVIGDIADLSADRIPPVDLVWSSSPCVDFSLAGARVGLAGERSGAALHVIRLLAELASAGRAANLVVFENVMGLKTSNKGADLAALTQALGGLGFTVRTYEIDAAAFVPQSRPRIFVVGARVPLEQWPHLPPPPKRGSTLGDILETGAVWDAPAKTAKIISEMSGANLAKLPANGVGAFYRRTRSSVPVYEIRFDGVAGCLRTAAGGSSIQKIMVIADGVPRTRNLTAREAARLMGLPEEYRLPASYSAAYTLVGDGVAAPAVAFLADNVLTPLAKRSHGLTIKKAAPEGAALKSF